MARRPFPASCVVMAENCFVPELLNRSWTDQPGLPTAVGYNPTSVERFNRVYSRSGLPDNNDPLWKAWRRQQVTQLVRRANRRLRQVVDDLGDRPLAGDDRSTGLSLRDAVEFWSLNLFTSREFNVGERVPRRVNETPNQLWKNGA